MKIALSSDHGGFRLKEAIKKDLVEKGYEVEDFGSTSTDSCDYPDFAIPVAKKVASGEFDRGILICGTGIGIGIVANKIKGVRAALCHDTFSAQATRNHNDANVLTMGERVVGEGLALKIVETFLNSDFEAGRHQRRIDKITALEATWEQ